MPTQKEKLEAYAAHLLDDLILLREKYELLRPLLFDEQVAERWGRKKRARGFQSLQRALFFSCAQDVAKIATDGDDRVPSLRNILERLDSGDLRDELREAFAVWRVNIPEDDPVIADALRRMEIAEEGERRAQFDRLYEALTADWKSFCESPELNAFKKLRDKVTAHTELRYHVDQYERVNLGSLGLKWGDLGEAIEKLQGMVERVGLIVRGASFAWDMLSEQLTSASEEFWLGESG